jgi:hypothetical protein
MEKTMKNSDKVTRENYVAATKSAVAEFFTKMGTVGDVKKQVHEQLDDMKRTVFGQILGFDVRWGRWEVDRFNGRKSVVTEELEGAVREAAVEWVDRVLAEFKDGDGKLSLYKELEEAVVKRYKSDVKDIVKREMWGAAQKHGRQLCDQLAEEAVAEIQDEIKDMISLRELPEHV